MPPKPDERGNANGNGTGRAPAFAPQKSFDNFVIRGFATPQECQALVEQAKASRTESATIGHNRKKDDKVRNNKTAFIPKDDRKDTPEARMRAKVDAALQSQRGADTSHPEPVQVQIYQPGQHYSKHTDSWENESVCKNRVKQRTWTCVLYLNDVAGGGTTSFPKAKLKLHRAGDPSRAPEQGTLACWYNVLPDLQANPDTQHQGDDVTKGEKFIANFWYNTLDKPAQACAQLEAQEKQQRQQKQERQRARKERTAIAVAVAASAAACLLALAALARLRRRRRRNELPRRQQQTHAFATANAPLPPPPRRQEGRGAARGVP